MKAFAYESPASIQQAVGDLADQWGQSVILAGGTDLLALMKEDIVEPDLVVNIKNIANLHGIEVRDDSIRIGATTTLEQIAEHAQVRKHLPALAEAAAIIGGPQIRNMGTMGGNLCQRTRDWYFRNRLDPETKLETQYSAIFPRDGQIYVHPSTLAPPLIAYGATVEVAGPKGNSTMPVEKLFQVSDLTNAKPEIVLAPNQIVTGVVIPVQPEVRSAEYEVRERQSHDWPLVQAAVALTLSGNTVKNAAIVLGHVCPVPLHAAEAEKMLVGKPVNLETATAAGKAAVQGAQPQGKNDYKLALLQVAVKRALLAAVGNRYWEGQS